MRSYGHRRWGHNLWGHNPWGRNDGLIAFRSQWKTDNAGTSNNDQITLPLVNVGTHNFIVTWGDGTYSAITAWDDAVKTHTYSADGTYNVKITGTMGGWRFQNGGDKAKILDISEWGVFDIAITGTFFGCSNLDITATDAPTVSLSSLKDVFYNCSKLTSIGNVAVWDVSSVTSLHNTFNGTSLFNQDLSAWNVGSVTNMINTFNLSAFNQDISSWDVSSVTTMLRMFQNNTQFNQDISSWDISSVTTMMDIFSGSNALSTVNYSAMLITWEALPPKNNVSAHFGNATYNAGAAAAKASLVAATPGGYGWTITDGGAA